MARYFKKRIANHGLPPGSLVFIGDKKLAQVELDYFVYSTESCSERVFTDVEKLPSPPNQGVLWLNVHGLHDPELMGALQAHYRLQPLALEDAMNTGQRAKFEEFEEHLFLTLKMPFINSAGEIRGEQVSIFFTQNMLISFQEQPGDVFEPVRQRLIRGKGLLRKQGPDYLAYALLDAVVDHYHYLIEQLGEKIDELELLVLERSDKGVMHEINHYKRELHYVLKILRPVKELMNDLLRSHSPYLHTKRVGPFYRDLQGLVLHAVESADTYRQLLTDYHNLYLSNLSYKMNDIMKVLTMFSAIFIPLSFFAGVYGTNFEYLPELAWHWAYPVFWLSCLSIAGGILAFFRYKRWL